MVILDTNLLIEHLRMGHKSLRLEKLLDKYGIDNLSVSTVSIQELFSGASSIKQENEILALLATLKIWVYDHESAKKAGEIERDFVREIEFADAAIAATCVINKCQLATLNRKDFEGIKGLEMVKI